MKIIGIYNIKGGVGKTSTVVNLAFLASKNYKVLVWDLDPQGASSFYLDKKVKSKNSITSIAKKDTKTLIKKTEFENLDLIPADLNYKNMDIDFNNQKNSAKVLDKLIDKLKKDRYDFLILDAPPTISLISENIFNASDYIFIPTVPTILSFRTYEQILKYFSEYKNFKKNRVLTFLSMVDRRKRMHKDFLDKFSKMSKDEVLKSYIPNSSQIERMGVYKKPVEIFSPYSSATKAYKSLWKEISELL